MLDFLDRLLTPCPWHVRAMGYVREAVGIRRRYRRCRADWQEHIDRCRETILRAELRKQLSPVLDIERLLAKVTIASANPRDLLALGKSLDQTPRLAESARLASKPISARLAETFSRLDPVPEASGAILAALSDAPPIDLAAGSTQKFDVPVDWGNYRIEISDPASGLTTKLPFFAGWSWNDENRGKEARPDKVKLALDKPTYHVGDTLKVTVTPPQAGPGLLLVESDHLLYSRNIDAKPGAVFEIPVVGSPFVFRRGSALSITIFVPSRWMLMQAMPTLQTAQPSARNVPSTSAPTSSTKQ